jgi:hypothetical protein
MASLVRKTRSRARYEINETFEGGLMAAINAENENPNHGTQQQAAWYQGDQGEGTVMGQGGGMGTCSDLLAAASQFNERQQQQQMHQQQQQMQQQHMHQQQQQIQQGLREGYAALHGGAQVHGAWPPGGVGYTLALQQQQQVGGLPLARAAGGAKAHTARELPRGQQLLHCQAGRPAGAAAQGRRPASALR